VTQPCDPPYPPTITAPRASATRRGVTVSFKLSKPSQVTVQARSCRRIRKRTCVGARVGTLKRAAREGRNSFKLTGSLGRALRHHGRYELRLRAIDRAGRPSGQFSLIVRR
jgi:hypothetical protein